MAMLGRRPGPGSREVCVPQTFPCRRSVTKPGIETPALLATAALSPGLRFQNLPSPAGRALSLILPWPSDRPVCLRAMSAVWHHRRHSDCDTPASGWMKTARPGPAAWHRGRRAHLDLFRTCRTRRRRVHRAGTERAGKHSKRLSAPRSGFDGCEAGNNRSLLSVTPAVVAQNDAIVIY